MYKNNDGILKSGEPQIQFTTLQAVMIIKLNQVMHSINLDNQTIVINNTTHLLPMLSYEAFYPLGINGFDMEKKPDVFRDRGNTNRVAKIRDMWRKYNTYDIVPSYNTQQLNMDIL